MQGAVDFVKVAMQPGMPQGCGTGDRSRRAGDIQPRHAIVTLPGNPVSALVSFEVFVRPALRAAMGLPLAAAPAAHRGAHRGPDLTGRQKRQFRRGVFDAAAGTVTTYGPRRRTICAGWHRQTACWRYRDVTAIAAGEQVSLWDLSSGGHP